MRFQLIRFGATQAGLFCLLTIAASNAPAQTVTWGVNGAGGSGTWDTTSNNWFNGTSNVTWPTAGNAIFAGAAGGTVTVSWPFDDVQASSMTFNTPGYVIHDGWLETGPSGLTVTTNANAEIDSTMSGPAFVEAPLVKNGTATLTLSGTNFLDRLQVDQGELRISESSSLFFSDVVLANASGVTVTLAQSSNSTNMGSLSGGGTTGGVVQPNDQPRTVNLSIWDGGIFGGTLQDNGNGVLALTVLFDPQTLTNANTYSGSTTISDELVLAENGSALNSSMIDNGTLVLDNSGTVLPNRVSDSLAFTLRSGVVRLLGNDSIPVEEFLGPLSLTSSSTVEVIQPSGAAAQLTFASLERSGHATLAVDGPGVKIEGLTNGAAGIVQPFITTGGDWAIVGSDGRLTNFTAYATDIVGSTTDHVKLSSGLTVLGNSATRETLNLVNTNPVTAQVVDLAGNRLELTSGGILSSGAGVSVIEHGTLTTSAQELVVNAHNALTIGASITDTAEAASLTKTGPGILTLTGVNSYSGPTAIMEGALVVASDENLGTGSTIELSQGTLKAAASFATSKTFLANSGGEINTAGFDVTLHGAIGGSLFKTGEGTLALTSPSIGLLTVGQGILELTNPTSGRVTILDGTVIASGRLSSLSTPLTFPTPILNIGGIAAATLVIDRILVGSGASLELQFGIGSAQQDFLSLPLQTFSSSFDTGVFKFNFHDLGSVSTGVDYPLMSFRNVFNLSPDYFVFAPGMADAGWAGTFTTTPNGLSVRFTSVPVPEPRLTALLLLQGAAIVVASRRFVRKSKSSR